MRNDSGGEGGVTYIGPRSFVVGFAVVCALFLGIACISARLAGSLETPVVAAAPAAPTAVASPQAAPRSITAPLVVTLPPTVAAPSASLKAAITAHAAARVSAFQKPVKPPARKRPAPRVAALTWFAVVVLRALPPPLLRLFHVQVNPVWIARTSGGTALGPHTGHSARR